MKKPRARKTGKWVFVADESISPEEREQQKMDEVASGLGIFHNPDNPFAACEELFDCFPGENELPEGGAWILVKDSPHTEYTVPPLSIWYAEPWPMKTTRHDPHRVKIVTPKGTLGLFPREYSRLSDPGKYYEFIGDGMEIHFFGSEEGVPKDKLFYIRSRGVSKKDALALLIGEIKAHGVLWIEADLQVCATFGMEMPCRKRLATAQIKNYANRP